MSRVIGALKSYAAYLFIAVGVAWAAVGVLTGSALVAWPSVACIIGGAFLRIWPGRRLTWAWALSTASMGFIVSVYQVYAWAPMLGGEFSSLAATALVLFAVFAAVHAVLFYAGASAKPIRPGTS